MNPYVSLRDDLYKVLETLFPTTDIMQAYTNGPEAATPYITYDIVFIDPIGMTSISGIGLDSMQQITSQYEAQVSLEFIGKQEDDFEAAALASGFEFSLSTPDVQDLLQTNALSLMRQSGIKRTPKKRETDWYMCHKLNIFFGYQVVARHKVDGLIETVNINDNFINNDLTP